MNSAARRSFAGAAAVLLLLAVPVMPWASSEVAAHAQLVTSSPGAGSIVVESPAELRLVFSEPLETQYTSLDLVDGDGTLILAGAGVIDPSDPYALVLPAPDLADGVYEVRWRTLSAADGHTGQGAFNFGVGTQAAPLGTAGEPMTHTQPDPARAVGRWLGYVGLLLALGLAVFHRAVVRDGPMPRTLVRLLAAGLGISSVATLAAAIGSAAEAGAVVEYLGGSRNGALQVARAALAAAGAGALLLSSGRLTGVVAALTGLLGIALLVGAGHAAAQPNSTPLLGQFVHVVAAAVWIGGIVGLLLLLVRPRLLTARDARASMRTYVPRFSAVALVAIGLVGLTGLHAAWVQTGSVIPPDTEYGGTLLLKTAFASAALALGGLNFLDGGRMRRWLDGMRARLTLEVTLIAVVLLLTAVLSITPPSEEVSGVAIEPVPDAFGEVLPGMTLEVVPGRPGINRVVASTTEQLAAGSPALELVLDRLDTGTSTKVDLVVARSVATGHEGMGMAMGPSDQEDLVDWVADAVVLPAGSTWDGTVRIVSRDGTELARQRFAFNLDEAAIDAGRVTAVVDPGVVIAALLFLGGAVGLGLGIGGWRLPRSEALASRMALTVGGATAALVGAAIALGRFVA